jgi:NAD(P)-dependent dehydrogenase (short-subunit alcohol dehydrogenase family)
MSAAVVTGAGRGIGRAVAEKLAAEGQHVVLVDLAEQVDQAATEVGGVAVRADISSEEGRRAIRAAVEELDDPLTVLVNNAGITRDSMLERMTEDAFLSVIRVNLGGAFSLTTELLDLLAPGSAVVNISSRAHLGNIGQFNYTLSKGAIVGLTRALARVYAPDIRVNAVAPGFTATEMTAAMPENVQQKVLKRIPLARAAQPQELARVISWLASHDASYVTGQTLFVDGGRSFT